ncbi:glycosyltransferase [Streptomyces sp. SL13]|uniref:Glycosyltransferase n=1 Tax=Streptantibioticus silvisoli TaxID=2705255 RepID=A0AA90H0D7_9ACTN|nr:glycosyltransferase [Streptantibioticus silvisoli]MDI5964415.1 glycosyltransferase [Streptantibioticus silvisoli]MDI5969061.1 glycosyltransferase [Streptantibioticus silvisoli]
MSRQLLVVSTNYAPEHSGIGPYSTGIAEHRAAAGDRVEVLAGMPHYPAWRTDPGYRGAWRRTEQRGGVTVHRRRHTVPARQTAVRRALYEASFLAHGQLTAPRGPFDLVLSQMPGLAGGLIGARLARRAGIPHVVVVQDLMGAAAAQSGIAGGGRVAGLAGGVEGRVLRGATLVGVVHETFRDRVAATGVAPDRIRVVPNWSHIARPSGDRARTRAAMGWRDDEIILLHSGNMGLKQGLEVMVETARLAAGAGDRLRVVLLGDGNQRAALERAGAGVRQLDFVDPVDDAAFPDVLAAADMLAVTQRASVLDMSIPSKLTSYFAAGRPVIGSVASRGGTAEEVLRSGAGVLVPPEDPAALLAAARGLADDPAAAARLGAHGPAYVDAHLSQEAGLARIDALIDEALARSATAGERAGR